MWYVLLLVLSVLFVDSTDAGTITRPSKSFGGSSFINGVVPQASDFNGDIDTIYTEFNGSVADANVSASAAISASKINPDGFTVNLRVVNNAPCKVLDESDQSADSRRWGICLVGGQLRFSTLSDAGAVQNDWFKITRADGGFTLGGASGSNVVNGATQFNHAVSFVGGTSLLPTGAVMNYWGASPPTGWLLMDGGTYSCTGTSSANANLCTLLVGTSTTNLKGPISATVTVDTSSDEIIHAAHGKSVGDRVHFGSTVSMPTGLGGILNVWCIISVTTDRYKVSSTCGGVSVDITTTGSGTISDYFSFLTPDARGRNIIGSGSGPFLTTRSIGVSGGEETHQLSAGESGTTSHSHAVTDPGHTHVEQLANGGSGVTTIGPSDANPSGFNVGANISTNSSTTGISIDNATPASAASGHNVMDPFLSVTYIIKL